MLPCVAEGSDILEGLARPRSTPPIKSQSLHLNTNTGGSSYKPKIRFSVDSSMDPQQHPGGEQITQ